MVKNVYKQQCKECKQSYSIKTLYHAFLRNDKVLYHSLKIINKDDLCFQDKGNFVCENCLTTMVIKDDVEFEELSKYNL